MNDSWINGKISLMIAGALGGLISLAFIKNLSTIKSLIAIIAGSISAYYITPFVATIYQLDTNLEDSVAFLVGLAAMNITGAIFNLTTIFKKDPIGTITNILNINKNKNDHK